MFNVFLERTSSVAEHGRRREYERPTAVQHHRKERQWLQHDEVQTQLFDTHADSESAARLLVLCTYNDICGGNEMRQYEPTSSVTERTCRFIIAVTTTHRAIQMRRPAAPTIAAFTA